MFLQAGPGKKGGKPEKKKKKGNDFEADQQEPTEPELPVSMLITVLCSIFSYFVWVHSQHFAQLSFLGFYIPSHEVLWSVSRENLFCLQRNQNKLIIWLLMYKHILQS